MEKKKVVIALGHRALGNTLPEQKEATKRTAKIIAQLVKEGAEVVISHSNAPSPFEHPAVSPSPVSQKTILIKYNSRVTSQCKGKSKTYTLGVPGYYQKSIQFPKPQTGIPPFLKRNLQRLNLIRFHLESRLISCKLYRICSFLHHITLDNRCQFLTEN